MLWRLRGNVLIYFWFGGFRNFGRFSVPGGFSNFISLQRVGPGRLLIHFHRKIWFFKNV